MATVGPHGPTASYAPCVRRGGSFYIYISALSRHTGDLKQTKHASILFIEDEKGSKNLFARKQITFTCGGEAIPRESAEWSEIITLFEKTFGKLFGHIKPLKDFILFRLTPIEAIYVEGFGRAYRMNPALSNPLHIRGTEPGATVYQEETVALLDELVAKK